MMMTDTNIFVAAVRPRMPPLPQPLIGFFLARARALSGRQRSTRRDATTQPCILAPPRRPQSRRGGRNSTGGGYGGVGGGGVVNKKPPPQYFLIN